MQLALSSIDRVVQGFLNTCKRRRLRHSIFQETFIEPLEPRQLMSLVLYWVQLNTATIVKGSGYTETNTLDDLHGWVAVDSNSTSSAVAWMTAVETFLTGKDPYVTVTNGTSSALTLSARTTENTFNYVNFQALTAAGLDAYASGVLPQLNSPYNSGGYFDPSSDEEFVYFGDCNYPGAGAGFATSNDPGIVWQVQTVEFPQFCLPCNGIYETGIVGGNPGNIDLLGGQAVYNGNTVDATTALSIQVPGTGETLGQLISQGPAQGSSDAVSLLNADPSNNSSPQYIATFAGSVCEIFEQDSPGSPDYTSTLPGSQVTIEKETGGYLLTDANGQQLFFGGAFGSSTSNMMASTSTDAGGNENFYDVGGEGLLSDVYDESSTDHTHATKTDYQYDGSGRVSTLTLSSTSNFDPTDRTSTTSSWTTIQTTINIYYDGTDPSGGPDGSLAMTIVENGSGGNTLSLTGYRYYSAADGSTSSSYQSVSDAGLVKMVFSPASMERIVAAGINFMSSSNTDTQLAPYADNYYTYDGAGRVATESIQSTGCSACTGGIGTFTYSYTDNASTGSYPSSDPEGYNVWTQETLETTPDGTRTLDFTDGAGLTMLEVVTDPGGEQWLTYYRYNADGQQILKVSPSGFINSDNATYNPDYPDLINFNNEDYGATSTFLSSNSGLFQWTDYYTASSATATSPGAVAGMVEDTSVSQGLSGTRYYQSFTDYYNYTAGGSSIVSVADSTTFPNNLTGSSSDTLTVSDFTSAGGDTTSYVYNYYPSSSQIESMTTELPVISTGHNGPGTSSRDTSVVVYDSFGRTIWSEDGNGYGTYTAYDPATGAVVTNIVDSASSQLPSSLVTILNNLSISFHSSGLGLTTTYQVDNQGRTIEQTNPNGNVTYTVYDDVDHAVFMIPDATVISGNYTTGTITTTGPMSMERDEIPDEYSSVSWSGTTSTTTTLTGSYSESLTFSGTLTVSGGVVVVPNFISSNTSSSDLNVLNLNPTVGSSLAIQSLSRSLENAGAQMIESDAYCNLGSNSNFTYLTTATMSACSGSVNTNFYATQYSYDDMGRQARTIDPNGTITDNLYDALGRLTATYVGTNDSPSADFNGYGNPASGNWEDFLYYVANHDLTVPSATYGTNMTLVTVNEYDFGGVGDGNLTETIQYPGGSQAPRASEYLYDWRDRQISSKSSVPTALPSGLTLMNIGSVTLSGTAAFDGTTFSVTGGGLGIDSTNSDSYGSDDGFTLLGQTLSGNTTLIVHINGATNVTPDAQEGLVLRDGSSGGALSAAVVFVPGELLEFVTRDYLSGAASVLDEAWDVGPNVWLELTRSGNTFTASYSTASTPTSWTTIGTDSIAMSTSLLGGLAVSSAADPALGTGIFDNASIGGTLYTSSLYETDGAHRPLTVNTFDNAGDVIATAQYDGDGISMVDANADGVPDGLSSSKLRAYSTSAYDEQGRAYQTNTYDVNPADGTYSTAPSTTLVSYTWYDHDGNTIASWSSGGPMTKMTYDGADRVIATYTTDGGAVDNATAHGSILMSWTSAGTVGSDVVLTQTNTAYDADGNAIETVTADRLPGDSATASGALFSATISTNSTYLGSLVISAAGGALAARISYLSDYYDAASRLIAEVNVGTNGGSSYERPVAAATVSSSTLLLTTNHYNTAGEQDLLTDPKGIVSKTYYDLLGRQTTVIENYSAGTNSGLPYGSDINQTTEYTYDGNNNILTETAVMPTGEHNQTTQYVYGGFTSGLISNDLLRMVEYPDTSTGSASTASGYTVVYSYDNLGDVLTMTDRNGNTHTYGYDALGRQISDSASTKPSPSIILGYGGLANSGFDEGSDTWTYSGDSGSIIDPGTGGSVGYLESGTDESASVSQTFSTLTGAYAISFDAAIRSGDTQGIDVTVDGVDLGTFNPSYGLDSVDLDNWLISGGTISMTGFMTGTLSLSTGTHTLTLTATATSGDNIAYLNNVNILQSSTESVGANPSFFNVIGQDDPSGEWTFQGPSGGEEGFEDSNDLYIGYGAYVANSGEGVGMSIISGTMTLDAGTYVLGFEGALASEGLPEGVAISLTMGDTTTVIGQSQPGDSIWTGMASDIFTITEPGTYTVNFSDLEYGGDTGNEMVLNDMVLFTPAETGTVSLGTIVAGQSIVTTYNSQGLVDTVTSYDAAAGGGNIVNQVKNVYDGFGDLTKQYQQHGSAVDTSSTLSTTYTYNTANTSTFGNRLASVTYPGGDQIDYNYTVSGTASLDSVISRLDSMSESGTTLESYVYMGLSTVVEEDHPQDGVNLTYLGTANGDAGDTVVGLDRFGRITDEKWTTGTNGGAGTVKDEYQYTYDEDGNVTSKVNVLDSGFTENYTYDGLSRLVAVSRGTDSSYQSFSLNSIGDISSVTTDGSEQDRTTNDENQITNIGGNTVSYDSNGNVTTDDHGDTLEYDAWNRLVAVYASDGTLIAGYTYDGLGRMTSETNITTTTDYYYSGTQEIEERTGVTDYTGSSLSSNGTTTVVNVYSPDYVNDILLRDSGGKREYFTHDANYDVTAAINTSGGVDERMVYDAYGAVTFYNSSWSVQSGDTLALKNLYQGMLYDSATGWYLTGDTNVDRWYSPTMDVWNRPDDAGYVDGLDNFEFVVDDPIRKVDPTGRNAADAWEKFWGGDVRKAVGIDITGSAVFGSGYTGAIQLVFFPDTDEIGLFGIANAVFGVPHPNDAVKDLLEDHPIGLDVSISVNGSEAIYRGPGKASPQSFSGVFYGGTVSGGVLGQVGIGAFWDPHGNWIGASVGVGVSPIDLLSVKSNPQFYWLLATFEVPKCISYALTLAMN